MRKLITLCVLSLSLWLGTGNLAAQTRQDDKLYDQVRLKLANHPDVKGGAIEVDVKEGVVTLQGKVRTEKAKVKAESVAGKVKGVKRVINELQVNPT